MSNGNKYNKRETKNRNKGRLQLVSGVLVTLLMITGVELDLNRTLGVDTPILNEEDASSRLTEDKGVSGKTAGEEESKQSPEEEVSQEVIPEDSETPTEDGIESQNNEVEEDTSDETTKEEEKEVVESETIQETTVEDKPEVKSVMEKETPLMQPRIMMMALTGVPNSASTALLNTRLTSQPVGITVSGTNPSSVKSIEMVNSPTQGRNYVINGKDVRNMIGYSLIYSFYQYEDLVGEEMTISFDANTEVAGAESVVNSVIIGGNSYPIEAKVTDDVQRFQYTIPKKSNVTEFDNYTSIEIKRGNREENIQITNVKVEKGSNATPYTGAPLDVKYGEDVNLFDKDVWLKTTAVEKPKTTGVPYVDIKLEPNTEYTLSTDMARKDGNAGYYDVFFMTTGEFASSDINGVGLNAPRTVTTKADGIVRVAMRDYDVELRDGTNWIKINKGNSAIPVNSKVKTYPVTANGNYGFQVTYLDGTVQSTSVNVNNFVSVKGNPYRWTYANVNLTLDASGGNPSKVTRIQLPNKQWVSGDSASYRVNANGTYTFIAEDKDGNQLTETVIVDKIDTGNPTLNAGHSPNTWTNQAVDIEVSAYDAHSGVEKVEMTGRPSDSKGGGDNLFLNSNFMFGNKNWASEQSGIFEIKDNTLSASGSDRFIYSIVSMPYGEFYTISFDARKDGTPTKVYAHQTEGKGVEGVEGVVVGNEWERHTQTIQIKNTNTISFIFEDEVNIHQFRNMKLEKGKVATPWIPAVGDGVGGGSSVFPVVTNGIYEFTATDYAGNTAKVNHEVTNIDSTPPAIAITKTQNGFTNGKAIDFTFDVTDKQSGLAKITLPDGRVLTDKSTGMFTVYDNGEYAFKLEDKVGNITTHTEKVTQFDRTVPTLAVTGNPTKWDDRDEITLTLTAGDTQSGVKSIKLPDNTIINSNKATYKVSVNGEYTFVVTDNIGNTYTHKVKVDKLMIPYFFYLYDGNGKPLQGAGFDLLRDGVKYTDARSDSTGLVDFGKVPPVGKYTIKQTKAPDGYIIDPSEKDVEVGDETEPEEFVSYPRGDVLPATGTNYAFKYLSILGLTTGVVLWVRSKRNKSK